MSQTNGRELLMRLAGRYDEVARYMEEHGLMEAARAYDIVANQLTTEALRLEVQVQEVAA